jgi:predicted ATPase/DNA-binding SARP family transcriptional activator
MLEIFTLGGLCIRLNGKEINDIGLRKAEALLVYLAVHRQPILRGVLAGLLWPEHSQTKALTSLRAALAVLNRIFSDFLDITHESVQFKHNQPHYLDIVDLQEKLSAGQIDSALDCFKGEFLAGFHVLDSATFEDWQLSEQSRIRDALMSALQDSLSIAINTRNAIAGLKMAHTLLELDAYNEYAHQVCMLLHAQVGDRTAALLHYQKCVEIFASELDIEPQKETQLLYNMILRGQAPEFQDAELDKDNLPQSTTSFVGRSLELFQILKLLKDHQSRLVTLVGPGGCGKTRLAIEVARLTRAAYPDGTFFVALEECPTEQMIVPSIANSVNFDIDTYATRLDPEVQLLDYLHRRKILLILDGFEALISGAALLARMLESVPGLKILVTSRQSLNLQCEWLYFVDGMAHGSVEGDDLPLPQVEAVRLFIERATQAKQTYLPCEGDYECIARICRLVDGMPLAIELAATWVSVIPVEAIEKELSHNLDFLSKERVDVPRRHLSIRAVFTSGWDLLSVNQQNLLVKLAIVESSCDHQAAAEVAHGDINTLSSLVKKSLLRCDHQGRFSIHNVIRMFAYERLTQEPTILAEVREAYCHYYLNLLITHQADLIGENMEAGSLLLRQEIYHLQKATQWTILVWNQAKLRGILSSTLVLYAVSAWFQGVEAFQHFGKLKLAALRQENDPQPELHPVVLICQVYQAFLLTNLGQIDESESISQRCLQPLHDMGFMAEYSVCLHNLGANASFRGEYETGTDLLEQAVLIGRESDFVLWPTYLLWLGHAYLLLGEYEAGLSSLEKCRELFLGQGSLWGAAFAISKIGLAYDGMGDHQKALEYHQEALSIFEKLGNIAGKGYSLSRMSMSACFSGNHHLAIRFGEEAYQLFEDIGHRWGLASTLPRLGFAYLGLGEVKNAHSLFIRAVSLSQSVDMIPMSLFALAGIACTMLHTGNQKAAIDLLSYVVAHPKSPSAFLDQMLSTLDPCVQAALTKKSRAFSTQGTLETISEVVKRFRIDLDDGL